MLKVTAVVDTISMFPESPRVIWGSTNCPPGPLYSTCIVWSPPAATAALKAGAIVIYSSPVFGAL